MTDGAFSPEAMTKMLQERMGSFVAGEADEAAQATYLRHATPEDFAALFGSPLGQKVLTQLVSMTYLNSTWDFSFPKERGYWREGQNSMVQHILDQLTAARKASE